MKTVPEKKLEEYTLLNKQLEVINNTLDIIKKLEDLKKNEQITQEETETLERVRKTAMLKVWSLDIASKDTLMSALESQETMKEFQQDMIRKFGY